MLRLLVALLNLKVAYKALVDELIIVPIHLPVELLAIPGWIKSKEAVAVGIILSVVSALLPNSKGDTKIATFSAPGKLSTAEPI